MLFIEVFGWSREEIELLLVDVKKEIKTSAIYGYVPVNCAIRFSGPVTAFTARPDGHSVRACPICQLDDLLGMKTCPSFAAFPMTLTSSVSPAGCYSRKSKG